MTKTYNISEHFLNGVFSNFKFTMAILFGWSLASFTSLVTLEKTTATAAAGDYY
jgi:hypothetical protein